MPFKVWNGSAWTNATGLKVWNGSSWVSASAGKIWNGSSWINFLGETQSLYVTSNDSSTYYPDPIGGYDYYLIHQAQGSAITPGTSSLISNATWWDMHWEYSYGVHTNSNGRVYFNIRRLATYGAIPNSGWSTVTITSPAAGTTTFNRTDLTFGTFNDGTYETASWATSSAINTVDPFLGGSFNASPATVTVRFQ